MTIKNVRAGHKTIMIRKFDIKTMTNDVTIAMIAKRASGKSYLTKEIMFHLRDLPAAVVISKTEKLNNFYTTFIPELYIYDEYNSSILDRIYQRQEQLLQDNERRVLEGKRKKDTGLMLIMDDCMSSRGSWVKEPQISELFLNGRHYEICLILTMQFALGIPPEMRSNFDFIFLLADDFINNRKRLYEHYAGMFPDFNTFQQVFLDLTENYGCMVINNRVHSTDITEKVFWYRAKAPPKFTMGSNKYKKFNDKKYDKNWNRKMDVFDPSILLSKRKQTSSIIIEKIK